MNLLTKTRVLILGIGQSNFLDSLYGNVLKQNSSFEFTISNYNNFYPKKNNKGEINNIYTDNLELNIQKSKLNGLQLIYEFIKFMFSALFWEVLFFEVSQNSSRKNIQSKIMSLVRTKYVTKHFINIDSYDIIQVHFCSPENVEWFYFISEKFKKIASFWGSDLFRLTGIANIFYVTKALEKCDVITVQTIDMAEVICSKYGSNFRNKIKDLRFVINPEIFEAINKHKEQKEELKLFKIEYNIPLDKIVIALGHNGFSSNNHVRMIQNLEELPSEYKSRICFLVHLGYGLNGSYYKELLETIESHKELNIVIINDLLEINEIAKLRVITDLMIQAPVSDALSAAMTEVLYAGNKVIAAAWLPYGILRRNGVVYDEFETFLELPKKIVANLETTFHSNEVNKKAIESFLFPNTTVPEWIKVFKNGNE